MLCTKCTLKRNCFKSETRILLTTCSSSNKLDRAKLHHNTSTLVQDKTPELNPHEIVISPCRGILTDFETFCV